MTRDKTAPTIASRQSTERAGRDGRTTNTAQQSAPIRLASGTLVYTRVDPEARARLIAIVTGEGRLDPQRRATLLTLVDKYASTPKD